MTTIDRLTEHMKELEHVELHGAGLEAVMDAGRAYRRRRTVGMTLAGVAAVAVLAFGAFTLQAALVEDEPSVADSDSAPLSRGDLEWAPSLSPIGFAYEVATDEGGIYLLSTAPGSLEASPQSVFTTTNGVDFTNELLPADVYVTDLAAGPGTLYAIGTAPGVDFVTTAATVRVGTSDDAGLTWDYTDIALAAAPPAGFGTFASAQTAIAADGDTVVAAVSTNFSGDYASILPEQFRGGQFGVYPDDEGVSVVDWNLAEQAMQQCEVEGERRAAEGGTTTVVVRATDDTQCAQLMRGDPTATDDAVVYRATWAELGLEGRPVYSELFVSDGSDDFEPVESPFPAVGLLEMDAVDGGFVAYVSGQGTKVWHSVDGRSWDELPGSPGIPDVRDIGVIDGRVVVVGGSEFGGVSVASTPVAGGPWTAHEIPLELPPGAELYVGAADVASGSVAVAVQGFLPDGTGLQGIYHTTDLEAWDEYGIGDVAGGRPGGFVESLVIADGALNVSVRFNDARGGTSRVWSVGVAPG